MRAATRRHRAAHGADALVEATLGAATRPLGTYEIRDILMASGERISVAQIYRVMARLVAGARVRRVETLNAYMICGAPTDAVAICTSCLSAKEIPIGRFGSEMAMLMKSHGFEAEHIVIEARGRCALCFAGQGPASP